MPYKYSSFLKVFLETNRYFLVMLVIFAFCKELNSCIFLCFLSIIVFWRSLACAMAGVPEMPCPLVEAGAASSPSLL